MTPSYAGDSSSHNRRIICDFFLSVTYSTSVESSVIGINRSLDKFSFDFIFAVRKVFESHENYHENKQLINFWVIVVIIPVCNRRIAI
jgi:hypothetical protein